VRLGDLLNKLGWSQAELARQAGVSAATVRHVLLGDSVRRGSSKKICDALGTALKLPLEPSDINEMKISDFQRKERQKYPRPGC